MKSAKILVVLLCLAAAQVVDTAPPVGETVAQACILDPHASFVSKVKSMIKTKKLSLFEHS
ncbi:hypothetical protein PQR34_07165 [Paraburkholderia sediminicola]|uniref:hypothetical protein n=1 Tax=Paraburkholderia sediminicola TaxID=458836 RepID=UPI0038BABF86